MADLKFPEGLFYAETDEWVKLEGDEATVGISDFAQDQLSDVVFVELPQMDTHFEAGKMVMQVESVKAVGDVYMPVNGTITAVNERLEDEPEIVNEDPYGEAWLFKFKPDNAGELKEKLMDAAAYRKNTEARS